MLRLLDGTLSNQDRPKHVNPRARRSGSGSVKPTLMVALILARMLFVGPPSLLWQDNETSQETGWLPSSLFVRAQDCSAQTLTRNSNAAETVIFGSGQQVPRQTFSLEFLESLFTLSAANCPVTSFAIVGGDSSTTDASGSLDAAFSFDDNGLLDVDTTTVATYTGIWVQAIASDGTNSASGWKQFTVEIENCPAGGTPSVIGNQITASKGK